MIPKEMPDDLKEQLKKVDNLNSEEMKSLIEGANNPIQKRKAGRPKGSTKPKSEKKIKAPRNLLGIHGAYSFLTSGEIPEDKEHLLNYAHKERWKWINQLGGLKNLNSMEISLIDEATRLLLYCLMINDYLLRKSNEDIVYKDKETGELKMHSALSRNYLAYTKTYVSILKELNKISKIGGSRNKSGGVDVASHIQDLWKNEN